MIRQLTWPFPGESAALSEQRCLHAISHLQLLQDIRHVMLDGLFAQEMQYNVPMTKIAKLFQKAQQSPQNLTFGDLCHLAEAFGFVWVHGEGSHRVYGHPAVREVLVFQPDRNGQAKVYQVKQLLVLIERYRLEV